MCKKSTNIKITCVESFQFDKSNVFHRSIEEVRFLFLTNMVRPTFSWPPTVH